MAKQKNADDLSEIMSNQLDILTAASVSKEDIRTADAVANMIGKTLKLCALRLNYQDYQAKGGAIITALEGQK